MLYYVRDRDKIMHLDAYIYVDSLCVYIHI